MFFIDNDGLFWVQMTGHSPQLNVISSDRFYSHFVKNNLIIKSTPIDILTTNIEYNCLVLISNYFFLIWCGQRTSALATLIHFFLKQKWYKHIFVSCFFSLFFVYKSHIADFVKFTTLFKLLATKAVSSVLVQIVVLIVAQIKLSTLRYSIMNVAYSVVSFAHLKKIYVH